MTIYCSLSKIKETLPLSRALLRHKVNSDICVVGIRGRVSTSSSLPRSLSTFVNDSKSVFPWRHDSSLPERVLEHNDLSGPFNPTARDPQFLRKIIAARELNIPIWDALPIPLHKNSWEVTLADNFAVAFSFATEELFRSIFQVRVANENGIVSLDSTTIVHLNDNNNRRREISLENNEYLYGMMDKKLIEKFNINPENLHLKFSFEPIYSELKHIFAVPVPGLTREMVEDNPYLRGSLYRLHTAYDENGFDEHYFDLLTDFAKHGVDKRTIIAEAVVTCREFFQVKDVPSNVVVQGMEDECDAEEVVHIVRFEVVTDEDHEEEGRKIGNWKIIDIDDLLQGNVFH